jgi:hypothetical protein
LHRPAWCRSLTPPDHAYRRAIVCDLSTEGFRLLVSHRVEPGTVLLLELSSNTRPLVRLLQGQVVWVDQPAEAVWTVGCALTSKMSTERLRDFLFR